MPALSKHYLNTFDKKVAQFNVHSQLPDYFAQMIGDKKHVRIAEIGAGPVNTIGDSWPGVEVELVASDVMADGYTKMWKTEQLVPIEYQDMENLTYPDKSFDIVHCVNALDHTKNPQKAIEEMQRVSRGYAYLRHAPFQRTRFGGHHYWDIYQVGDLCAFESDTDSFMLEGFETTFEKGTKDNWITSIWSCQS